MGADLTAVLLAIASSVGAALLMAAARTVRRLAATVKESATAATQLSSTVATLASHDAENRERIAALWAHTFGDYQPPWRYPDEYRRRGA